MYDKCLATYVAKYLNQTKRIPSLVSVLAVALQTNFYSRVNFCDILTIWQKSVHVLSTSSKNSTVYFENTIGEYCGSRCWRQPVTGRQVNLCLHKIFARAGGVKSQPLQWHMDSDKDVLLSHHSVNYFSWKECHRRVDEDDTDGN